MAPNGDARLMRGGSPTTAPHRSIGEVLALLKDEFPDITISKIRFLESQGLLDPERTPSGYRRFYDRDVERLRWILHQQRENFLPLKVIKGRLAEGADTEPADAGPSNAEVRAGTLHSDGRYVDIRDGDVPAAGSTPAGPQADPSRQVEPSPQPLGPSDAPRVGSPSPAASAVSASQAPPAAAPPAPSASSVPPAPAPPTSGQAGSAQTALTLPAPAGPVQAGPSPASGAGSAAGTSAGDTAASSAVEPPGHGSRRVLPEPALFTHRAVAPEPSTFSRHLGETSVSLTAEELAVAAGLDPGDIAELERFDLIEHRSIGSTAVYDDEALLVARAASLLRHHGVEPRHLRMYKVAADREAGVYEQVVVPILRQRDPESRRRAADTLEELARLGEGLHAAMLRRALKRLT